MLSASREHINKKCSDGLYASPPATDLLDSSYRKSSPKGSKMMGFQETVVYPLIADPRTIGSADTISHLMFSVLFFFIDLFIFWQLLGSERAGAIWGCPREFDRKKISSLHCEDD